MSILGALTLHLGFFSASLVLQPTRMALLCALLGTALTFKNTFKEMVQPSLEDQGSKERAWGETWTFTGVDARPNRPSQLTYLTASDTMVPCHAKVHGCLTPCSWLSLFLLEASPCPHVSSL